LIYKEKNGGAEEDRTPDLRIANPMAVSEISDTYGFAELQISVNSAAGLQIKAINATQFGRDCAHYG
jgi:hypothetical protein